MEHQMANEKKSAGNGATPGSAAHDEAGTRSTRNGSEAAAHAAHVAALLPDTTSQARSTMCRPAGAVLRHPAFGGPPVHNEVRAGRRKGVHPLSTARRARRARHEAASRTVSVTHAPVPDAAQNDITLEIALRALTVHRNSETQAARFSAGEAVLARRKDGTLQPAVIVRGYSLIGYRAPDGATWPRVGYAVEVDGGYRAFVAAGEVLDLNACARHLRLVGAQA
jgi:hypothetical protein